MVHNSGVIMKRQTSTKGFAVLSVASLISKVLAFIYLPIQAMLVHDNGNGVISAGFKLYILIYALTNAGLPTIISKFISSRLELGDYKGARVILKSAFTVTFTFGVVASLFTFFGAGLLAGWCKMPESRLMFLCIAPTFLFSSISCSLHGYFQGRHNMTPTAMAQIVEQIFNSVLTALLEILFFSYAIQMNHDVVSFTAAGSAIATVLAVMASASCLTIIFFKDRRRQRDSEESLQTYDGPPLESRDVYRQLIRFTIPALLTTLASGAIDLIDTGFCIPMLMAGGYSNLDALSLFGIYSTKYQRLLTLPVLFATPLITAMIPSLSAAVSRRDFDSFTHKIREGFRLNFIVVLPLTAALSVLAHPIITVIFMSQNSGSLMVTIGIWTALLTTVQTVQNGVLVALNRPRIPPITMLVGMFAKIACNYLLIPIPSINIYGALIGNVLDWVISIAINQYFIRDALGRELPIWRSFWNPFVAAISMALLSLCCFTVFDQLLLLLSLGPIAANDIAMLVTIPFGGVVYYIMSVRMGIIMMSDLQKLPMSSQILSLSRKIPFLKFRDVPNSAND